MKADQALKILRVNRVTLHRYVADGKIKAVKLESGRYEYDDDSIWNMAGYPNRINGAYISCISGGCVNDLKNKLTESGLNPFKVEIFCDYNDDRTSLKALVREIVNHRIKTLYLYRKEDLPIFNVWEEAFNRAGCKIEFL